MAVDDKVKRCKKEVIDFLENSKMVLGRLIAFDKSWYLNKNPDHLVSFNSNLYWDDMKIWYGDIDCDKDYTTLLELSTYLGGDIYITRESQDDGRMNSMWTILDKEIIKKVKGNYTFAIIGGKAYSKGKPFVKNGGNR